MITFKISHEFIDMGFLAIHSGYKIAETVLNSPDFASQILKIQKLTYTKDSPIDIWDKFLSVSNKETIIKVNPYYSRSKNVVGYTNGSGQIFVNTNGALWRNSLDYMRNAVHEFAHDPLGYGHGSNFPNGWRARMMGDFADKNNSVPYLFEEIAIKVWRELGR